MSKTFDWIRDGALYESHELHDPAVIAAREADVARREETGDVDGWYRQGEFDPEKARQALRDREARQMAEDYSGRTVDELKDELRGRTDADGNALPVSGTKDELIARLQENDQQRGGETTSLGVAPDQPADQGQAVSGQQALPQTQADVDRRDELENEVGDQRL